MNYIRQSRRNIMHNYIDYKLVHDCTKPKAFSDVFSEIKTKYEIKNIKEDADWESLFYICRGLYEDYTKRNTNYEAYIEKGMDARLLMELRKSALFPFTDKKCEEEFFNAYRTCETVDDVKNVRISQVREKSEYYEDANWQYYYLMKLMYNEEQFDNFYFDVEICYKDGDSSKQTNVQDYINFVNNALFPYDFD